MCTFAASRRRGGVTVPRRWWPGPGGDDNAGMEPTDHVPAGDSRTGMRWPRRGALVVALVAYAPVAALCRPLTTAALVAVLVPGVLLSWFGVRRRPGAVHPVGARSAVAWLAIAGLAAAYEIGLLLGPNDRTYPTLSTLIDPVLSTYPGRVTGYVLWLGVGAWLVSR